MDTILVCTIDILDLLEDVKVQRSIFSKPDLYKFINKSRVKKNKVK